MSVALLSTGFIPISASGLSHSSMPAMPQTVFRSHAAYLRGPFWDLLVPVHTPRILRFCLKCTASILTCMQMTHNSTTASTLVYAESVRDRLTSCISEVANWCASRRLQLNAEKTKMIWFGSRSSLTKLQRINQSLQVGTDNIQPSSVVRDLRVYLDSELSMKQHVARTAAACFYHIRRLRQIRRRVGQEVTQQLVLALIMSRLDTVAVC